MKLTASIVLLPLAVIATPITSPNPSAEAVGDLLPRADKYCWLAGSTSQGCDSSPTSQTRVRTVRSSDRFGVRCTARGRSINGNNTWDWVPGWGCWIWSGWTQVGCEGGLPACL